MAEMKFAEFTLVSEREEKIVMETLQEFSESQLWRNTTAAMWEEIAQLILPSSRNTFMYGSWNFPGQKKTDRQVDATGMMALNRFGAIMDSLLTPRNQIWHQLKSDNPALQADRATRLWYEQASQILFSQRYDPVANFSSQNQQNYQSLGAFGTCAMFIDQAVNEWNNPIPKLRYRAIPIGELFIHENHQGQVDSVIRWFRLTARQALQKFGDRAPAVLRTAFEKHSDQPFNFLHRITPRYDFEPGRLDEKGKPYVSYYVSIEGRSLLQEGAYRSFPIAVGRYDQAPGEVYGRGPASAVLPALKTLNAEKTTFLKVGHRAADPVLLTFDDGLIDPALRPGSVNKGGMNADGRPLVGVLPTGEIQITEKMMEVEASLVNDAFLVTLFQILTETPTMTATEVIERTNEKGILLAPTVGRQQSEYLGPMIHRELDLLMSFGALPPMPPMLRQARGNYGVKYTSPLARAQRAQEVAGLQRTVQSTLEIVNATGDASILDNFNFDKSTRDTAEIQAVPETWMATDEEIQQKRQNRAKQAQQAAQIQALPAQAAMIKAQAVVQKGNPDGGGGNGGPGQVMPGQPTQPGPQGQPQPGPGGQ